jgi:hypothetical protein
VSTTFELEYTKRRLRKQIDRAHRLTERLTTAAADRSLALVDRETDAHRAKLSIETSQELERSLERIEEALA